MRTPKVSEVVATVEPATRQPPRWRFDAVAASLALAEIALAAALAGSWGADIVRPLTDSLGLGLGVLLAGWFTLIGMYVARRSWPRLGVRALGWIILIASTAALADRIAPAIVSIYGPGGAVGAWLRIRLDGLAPFPLPGLLLAALLLVGLTLAMDGVVRAALRFLVRGNAFVGRSSNAILQKLKPNARTELVSLTAVPTPGLTISADIPITRPEPTVTEGPVPIHPAHRAPRGEPTDADAVAARAARGRSCGRGAAL